MQSSSPLPVIQSNPHAGLAVPPELKPYLQATAQDLANDADLWADLHFDFAAAGLDASGAGGRGRGVLATISMPVARALVDVNRRVEDMENPDGPVKTMTSYGRSIYTEPPPAELRTQLMAKYYTPFHAAIAEAMAAHGPEVKLFLDCHNMAQLSPSAYAFAGEARPLICLANLGDENGDPRAELGGITCAPELLRACADVAGRLFADLDLLEPVGGAPVVRLNWPFHGGAVLRNYLAGQYGRPLGSAATHVMPPAIMVEVNRGLFVGNQSAASAIKPPDLARIGAVRSRLYQWTLETLALLA